MTTPVELFNHLMRINSQNGSFSSFQNQSKEIQQLLGLFSEQSSPWKCNASRLLMNAYKIEKEYQTTGKVSNKQVFNSHNADDGFANIIGPFYFAAETGTNETLSLKNSELSFSKINQNNTQIGVSKKKESENSRASKEQPSLPMNQTFDSSFFHNPSEKDAFNVSQLNTSFVLNFNSQNQHKKTNFQEFERIDEMREEYIRNEHSQPNVTSYNGQCPYFVNEKQYDAIIRRRKKKQKRMLLYGKSRYFLM